MVTPPSGVSTMGERWRRAAVNAVWEGRTDLGIGGGAGIDPSTGTGGAQDGDLLFGRCYEPRDLGRQPLPRR